jgi:hypothetical protein
VGRNPNPKGRQLTEQARLAMLDAERQAADQPTTMVEVTPSAAQTVGLSASNGARP